MSGDRDEGEWLTFFARLGDCYRTVVLAPLWETRFDGHLEDPWAALGLFLYGYGLGRRGGSGRGAGAGAKALEIARGRGPFPGGLSAAEAAWEILSGLSSRAASNPRGHPLYPSSDPRGLGVRPRPSLLEVRYVGDVTGHQGSLTEFASSLMARDDLTTVLDLLTGIRGVGGTRAGWFLRDLAVWEDRRPGPEAVGRLEPVDAHVRRTVAKLAGGAGEEAGAGGWLSARAEAHGLRPHRVSAGISYFGERIAGDPFTLEECLDELTRARRMGREHRRRLARAGADAPRSAPLAGRQKM